METFVQKRQTFPRPATSCKTFPRQTFPRGHPPPAIYPELASTWKRPRNALKCCPVETFGRDTGKRFPLLKRFHGVIVPNDLAFVSTGSTFPRGRIPKTFPRHRICPHVETFGATLEGNVLRRWPRGNVLNVSTWRNSAYAHSGARMTGVDDPRGNVSGAVQTFPRGGCQNVST